MWFVVLVYVVSDVMDKIARQGQKDIQHTTIPPCDKLQIDICPICNLWNGLLTQSVAQQMSVCSKFQHYKDYIVHVD